MRVVVIGSANLDYVTQVARRPTAGETVLGSDLVMTPGGKGANQAVAAGLLDADVSFAGCLGNDSAADLLRDSLVAARVDTSMVRRVDASTGAAMITVTPDGENSIVVSPGANTRVTPDYLMKAAVLDRADIVVMQLEVPIDTVEWVADQCAGRGIRLLLNAAPAAHLSSATIGACDPLIVNETEAQYLLGDDGATSDPTELAASLLQLGARSVVITLGAGGVVASSGDGFLHQPAMEVQVVDTTGAGDAFVGALASALADRAAMPDALAFATRVAGLAVQRAGAQASYRSLSAIDAAR